MPSALGVPGLFPAAAAGGVGGGLTLIEALVADVPAAGGIGDLVRYTLPANTIITAGGIIVFRGWGTHISNGNAKTVQCFWGTPGGSGASIFRALPTFQTGGFFFEFAVQRQAAASQRVWIQGGNDPGTGTSIISGAVAATEDLTAPVEYGIEITTAGTAAGNVTLIGAYAYLANP